MTDSFLRRWILNRLDAVSRDDSTAALKRANAAAEAFQAAALRELHRREEVERRLEGLSSQLSQLDSRLGLREWTSSHLVEFYADQTTPVEYVNRTLASRRQFARDAPPGMRYDIEAFIGGSSVGALFWAVTHASRCACAKINALSDENTSTLGFAHQLRNEIDIARDRLGVDLKVAVGSILGHRRPALKELSVGADLLLVVSGDGLVPGGGARLFWIQFKLADTPLSLRLDVHAKTNARGETQFEALQRVHQPPRGSYSLYALGAIGFSFYSAMQLDGISGVDVGDASTCKIELGIHGQRFQELLTALATRARAGARPTAPGDGGKTTCGSFFTAREVVEFVDAAAGERSIVPLDVLAISSGNELVNSRELVHELSAAWTRRVNDHIRSLELPNRLTAYGKRPKDRGVER